MAYLTANNGQRLLAADGRFFVDATHENTMPVDLGVITDPKVTRLTPTCRALAWRTTYRVFRLTPRYKVEDL